MKNSLRLIAFAVLSCAAFVSSSLEALHGFAVATYRAVKSFVYDAFKLVAAPDDAHARPAVAFVQAKAFVQRIMKRERPQLTGSWRMCPSI